MNLYFLLQNVGIDKGDIPDLAKVSEMISPVSEFQSLNGYLLAITDRRCCFRLLPSLSFYPSSLRRMVWFCPSLLEIKYL